VRSFGNHDPGTFPQQHPDWNFQSPAAGVHYADCPISPLRSANNLQDVHCLVSGGGISDDASTWHPARRKFLLPIKALAKLVRGKFRALLRQKCPDLVVPDTVWHTPWILHISARGNGKQAVLDYLARYVFRVALTNGRIVGLDNQTTIQYKDRKTGCRRTCRLSGDEFMRRLPRVPSRHGDLLSPTQFMRTALTRTTAPAILKLRSSPAMRRSCASGHHSRAATIHPGTERPG